MDDCEELYEGNAFYILQSCQYDIPLFYLITLKNTVDDTTFTPSPFELPDFHFRYTMGMYFTRTSCNIQNLERYLANLIFTLVLTTFSFQEPRDVSNEVL